MSEVHMLLEDHIKKLNESEENELEPSDVFVKTLDYTQRFSKFKNKEMIASIKNK